MRDKGNIRIRKKYKNVNITFYMRGLLKRFKIPWDVLVHFKESEE